MFQGQRQVERAVPRTLVVLLAEAQVWRGGVCGFAVTAFVAIVPVGGSVIGHGGEDAEVALFVVGQLVEAEETAVALLFGVLHPVAQAEIEEFAESSSVGGIAFRAVAVVGVVAEVLVSVLRGSP